MDDTDNSVYFSMNESDMTFDGNDESTLKNDGATPAEVVRSEKKQQPNTPLLRSVLARTVSHVPLTGGSPKVTKSSTPVRNKENAVPNTASPKARRVAFVCEPDDSPIGLNGTRVEESHDSIVITSGRTWQEIKETALSPTELLLKQMGSNLSDLNLEEPPFSGRPSLAATDFEVMIPKTKIRTPAQSSADDDSVEIVSDFEEERGRLDFELLVERMENAKVADLTTPSEKSKRRSLIPKPTSNVALGPGKLAATRRNQFATKQKAVTEDVPKKPATTLGNRRSLHPTALKSADEFKLPFPAPPLPVATIPPQIRRRPVPQSSGLKAPAFKIMSSQSTRRLSNGRASPKPPRIVVNSRKSILPTSRKSLMPPPLATASNNRRTILPSSTVKANARAASRPSSVASISGSLKIDHRCKYCDKKFAVALALEAHMREKCPKVPPHVKKQLLSQDLDEREGSLRKRNYGASGYTSDTSIPSRFTANSVGPKIGGSHKKGSHTGILRTPTKLIECKRCNRFFADAIEYASHMALHASM